MLLLAPINTDSLEIKTCLFRVWKVYCSQVFACFFQEQLYINCPGQKRKHLVLSKSPEKHMVSIQVHPLSRFSWPVSLKLISWAIAQVIGQNYYFCKYFTCSRIYSFLLIWGQNIMFLENSQDILCLCQKQDFFPDTFDSGEGKIQCFMVFKKMRVAYE